MSCIEGVIALQSMVTEDPLGIQMVQPTGTVSLSEGKIAVAPPSHPGNDGTPSAGSS